MSLEHLNGVSPWTPEVQETVRRLFATGIFITEIARHVGMSKNQVSGWLDRHDLKRKAPAPLPATLDDRLCAYHDKLDAALAECRSIPRIAPPLYVGKIPNG
jgi:transposase-like protein